MLAVDPATGRAACCSARQAAPQHWINLTDNYKFLDDGSLIWWSERDGFGHLYRFADGKWTQLTQRAVGGREPRRRRPGFAPAVLHRHQGRSARAAGLFDRLSEPGEPQRLTDLAFVNDASMDKKRQTLLVTPLVADPAAAGLSCRPERQAADLVEENRLDAESPLRAVSRQPPAADVRHDQGGRRDDALLEDDHAAARSRASAIRCSSSIMADRPAQTVTKGWVEPLARRSSARAISISRSTTAAARTAASTSRSRSTARWARSRSQDQKAGADYS